MTLAISGKEWSVGDLFGREFVFSIPPYQRPYAWETEQAKELFDDVVGAMGQPKSERDLDDAEPYFLGSIVVIKNDGRPEAEVVDGQQRLTTLTLLLSALRAQIADKALCSQLRELTYEPENRLRRTPARYRLTLRERDAAFFRKHLQVDGAFDALDSHNEAALSDSQRNLVKNAKTLRACVASLNEKSRELLAQYIVARCFVVVVSTTTFDAAYRIFSVLNDRGLDLSHADVLKAEVLGKIERDADRDRYAGMWEQIEDQLGRDAFKDLIGHIRTIYVRKKPEKTVLAEVRENVVQKHAANVFVDDILGPYADAFDVIRRASFRSTGDAGGINALLRWLERIDNVDWVPIALVLVSRMQSRPDELERALKTLEQLASVLMVARADINERMSRYGEALGTASDGDVDAICAALRPRDEEKTRALGIAAGELYLNAKVRSHVLFRIDAALAESRTPHASTATVEHVLPQTPANGSNWLAWWPDPKVRDAWTHKLGNLLLLTGRKNAQAQNYEFDEKKTRYFSTKGGVSNFPLTTQVLQEKTWTPEVVARRQKEMLAVLERTWSSS